MAFNVSTFREKLAWDGARPNLFEVIIPKKNQWFNESDGDLKFLCKAASIPGSTIGTVVVPYMGREIKLAGNRTFADWTITVINDENFSYRSEFEFWMEGINTHTGNYRTGNGGVNDYVIDSVTVNQISKAADGDDANILRSYLFHGMFPIDISEITLDWGDNDSIEEFTVTFAYDYWTAEGGNGPTATTKTGPAQQDVGGL